MLNIYFNVKTGELYQTLGEVTNTTNSSDGEKMVLYKHISKDKLFCRERQEFYQKFSRLQNVHQLTE